MKFTITLYLFRRSVIISNLPIHERPGRHNFEFCHVIVRHYTRFVSTQKRHQTPEQQAAEKAWIDTL